MHVKIKTIGDFENAVGKPIARNLLAEIKSRNNREYKKVPSGISFVKEKPAFYLSDGSTLTAYLVNLSTGDILSRIYCGSGDTAINHQSHQFSEGSKSKEGFGVFFIETYYAGNGKTGWTITVVSDNVQTQVN